MGNCSGKCSCTLHAASKCRCHCRENKKFPAEVTSENIKKFVDASQAEKFLNSGNPLKQQYAWYDVQLLIDFYFIWLILFEIIATSIEHIVPFSGHPWANCTNYTGKGEHGPLDVWCVVSWHVYLPFLFVIVFYAAYMALAHWSHGEAQTILRWIQWINILYVGYFALTMGEVHLASQNEFVPTFQKILFFIMLVLVAGTLGFGFYVQQRIGTFLYPPDLDYNIAYPSTEDDIVSLVLRCRNEGLKLRCIGSHHSQTPAIYDNTGASGDTMYQNGSSPSGSGILMSLDNYRDIVSWDDANKRVTVEGGLLLGKEETKSWSTMKNGLCYQVNERGWALPDLGGVIKQSVAGFTAMGCAGGTIDYDYYDAIYSMRIIDANGDIHIFTKPDDNNPDDQFYAACVNMGLFGITSEITFQCIDKFYMIGSQLTMTQKEMANIGTDKFKEKQSADGFGKLDLRAKTNESEYSLYNVLIKNKHNRTYSAQYWRFYWWPQLSSNEIVFWKAHRMIEEDLNKEQYKKAKIFKTNKNGEKIPKKPYIEIGNNNVESFLEQSLVAVLYNFFGNLVNKKTHEISDFLVKIIRFLIKQLAGGGSNCMIFGDVWYKILPMDQGIDDRLCPFEFTELWIDIEQTQDAINACWEYFESDHDLNHTGTFGWEFYLAGSKSQWIRPNYNQSCFRIDILWFNVKDRIPYTFYYQFWEFLIERGVDFRPHWGKWCPFGNEKFPTKFKTREIASRYEGINTWADYYRRQYPKMKQWNDLREQMDPYNMFLTKYWSNMLGIDDDNEHLQVVPQPVHGTGKNAAILLQQSSGVATPVDEHKDEYKE